MKQLVSLFAVLIMMLNLTGCKGGNADMQAPKNSSHFSQTR